MQVVRPTWISFGGTAAIVTSMGLILGLDAASTSRETVVSALLIFALADNLTDSLSVHAYQEAEHLEASEAFSSTVANFVVRLLVALSFVAIVAFSARLWLSAIAGAWGFSLLALLTYQLAKARNVNAGKEILKHVVVAACVIVVSRWVGAWIASSFR
jgi:hypothetical protein